jgi:hypothetical protein
MGFLRDVGNFITFGAIDRYEANEIVSDSQERENIAREELEDAKNKTQYDLENFGILKAEVYSKSLHDFARAYEVIGAVDLSPLKKSNDSIQYKVIKQDMLEIKKVTTNIKDVALLAGGGTVGGAVAVCGALGLAGIIGTASTGTAIGTLSGAAATNATLAWLGGGALSAGGAGVTGGVVVLGGIALVPLAVFGMFLGVNNGKQNLNAAKDYSDQIDVLVERVNTLIKELAQIRRGCHIMSESIKGLDGVLSIHIEKMDQITRRLNSRSALAKYIIDPIRKRIFRVSLLTDQEAQIFCDATNCASMLKQLIEKPLMNEEGGFISEVLDFLETKRPVIDKMLQLEQSYNQEPKVMRQPLALPAN